VVVAVVGETATMPSEPTCTLTLGFLGGQQLAKALKGPLQEEL